MACPPETSLRFAIVLYYLLWNYRSRGDAIAAGVEASSAVAPKSVEKILWDFNRAKFFKNLIGEIKKIRGYINTLPKNNFPAEKNEILYLWPGHNQSSPLKA